MGGGGVVGGVGLGLWGLLVVVVVVVVVAVDMSRALFRYPLTAAAQRRGE